MTLDSCVYMAGPRLWVCALDMIQASSNPMGHRLAHLDFSGKGLEARTGGKLPGLLQGPRDQHHGDMAHRPRGSVANQQMLLGKTGRGRTCSSQCFWCRRCYWITLSFNWFCFSMISEGFEIISASFAYFMRNMTLDWGSQKRLLSPTLMALSRLGKKKHNNAHIERQNLLSPDTNRARQLYLLEYSILHRGTKQDSLLVYRTLPRL